MEEILVDYVVIGSGPAGQKAAIQAAKLGKSVAIIEKEKKPGGASLHSGTIPSKSLREAILDLTEFYKRNFYAQFDHPVEVSINDLNFRLHQILDEQKKGVIRQIEKNNIRLLHGTASFEDSNTLVVCGDDFTLLQKVRFFVCLIATGSRPRNPETIPFDNERVLDSTRLLSIDVLPKTMIVLGGGIIGSEYASFFAALGAEVTIVDKRDRILPLLDAEIGMHLQKALSCLGLKVLAKKEVRLIERQANSVIVSFQDGTQIEGDIVLYALGREACVQHLQMEKVGLALNKDGYIPVNDFFQTAVSHIYAAGDVIGAPALASTSMEQGRLAARHAFGADTHPFPSFYPIGIYTIPEISSCGYTEEELKTLGFRYEVGRAYYYEIARSQIAGNDPGLFKILFHADTLEILGVHIVGIGATELIHIGQVAMSFKATVDYFIDQVFNYPTYAEGYRIAALNGCNKVRRKK